MRKATVSFVSSQSVWDGSAGTGRFFHETLYLWIFRKCVDRFQLRLKSEKKSRYFT
jgi:hypothetical protein